MSASALLQAYLVISNSLECYGSVKYVLDLQDLSTCMQFSNLLSQVCNDLLNTPLSLPLPKKAFHTGRLTAKVTCNQLLT